MALEKQQQEISAIKKPSKELLFVILNDKRILPEEIPDLLNY